jgi:hypothetical protein
MMIDNVTKEGKTASGYIVAAGSMFVLGAAIPNHTGRCRTITLTLTVLEYGAYFPPGTMVRQSAVETDD